MNYHNMGSYFREIIFIENILEKLFWRNYFEEIIFREIIL